MKWSPARDTRPALTWRARITEYAVLLSVAALLATLIRYVARYSRLADLATNFTAFYWAASILALVAFTATKRWRVAPLALIPLLLTSADLVSWYVPSTATAREAGTTLRLMECNVLTSNERSDRVLALVRQEKPDVIAFLEVNDAWLRRLQPLEADYPYSVKRPSPDNFGMAFYSRLPLDSIEENVLPVSPVHTMAATVTVNGTPVRVIAVHTLPPIDREYASIRNQQLAELGEYVVRHTGLCVALGDLNTAMWSPFYKDMEAKSGLRGARYRTPSARARTRRCGPSPRCEGSQLRRPSQSRLRYGGCPPRTYRATS